MVNVKRWIPFVEVECTDGRVRVYENSKQPYGAERAKKAAIIMRDEHNAFGANVICAGIEKVK